MFEFQREITIEEIRTKLREQPQILEIGANDGTDTLRFLKELNATVVCFEPDSRPLARLRERVAAFADRVTIYPYALGAINGTADWYASHGERDAIRDWDYSGSLRKPTAHLTEHPHVTFSTPIPIECRRLDDLGLPSFDFAWIDVQGAQRDVIAGGRVALDAIPWIYIEQHVIPLYDGETTREELCALLPAHRLVARYAENLLFQRAPQ